MKLLLILGILYVGIAAALYFAQTWLIFPGTGLPTSRLDGPLGPERLEIETEDGARLHGMVFRADGDADLVIGFGGNAQDAEMLAHDLQAQMPGRHIGVFHYRGYGPSTGRPGEQALLADALLIHDTLVDRLRPRRVFAAGFSLGSAVAAYLSAQRALAGVLLVTPFDSIEAVAKQTYFWLPVGLLLKHKFRSAEFMRDNPTPAAVISAEHDGVVKPARTEALVRRLDNLVFRVMIQDGSHSSLYALPAYEDALDAAFAALERAAAEASASAARQAASD
jgi:alpha-beta hydrolase superfamily lysophospholipase